ncbi:MAG: hypothetical protein ABI207_04165 [Crocinitomicaceae bacterium]
MRKLIIIFFILIANIANSQSKKDLRDIFQLQCWKNTIKKIDTASIIISIQNSFDNWNEKNWARKPIVIYYRDSSFHWYFKIVLFNLEKKIWQETESSLVKIFFENYLNENSDKIKLDFKDLHEDLQREWSAGTGYMKFYYRDSTDEIINDYYSSSFGINELVLSYPLVFNMYSYAMNMSFNVKFKTKSRIK